MNIAKRFLSAALAIVMLAAIIPAAALAFGAGEGADDRAYRLMDEAWASLEAVEADMEQRRAAPSETVLAVYKAALNNPLIDAGTVVLKDANGFEFRVDNCANAYDYRVRNVKHESYIAAAVSDIASEMTARANTSSTLNVLLIGPMYDSDSSFTDQYTNEIADIGSYTGGTVTTLLNSAATATAICAAFPNNGVIIFDSHGSSYYSTSYLCLSSSTGISSSDYNNNYALNFGSGTYGIDGRFIRYHSTGSFQNCLVWMAICEGMKTSVFGVNLTAKGAAVVYGYSQSVSFTGDYRYEAAFYDKMFTGATVAEAISTMKSRWGNYDSLVSPNAYPVVVSATDSYPSNPDSVQTVTSDWVLPNAGLLHNDVTAVAVDPSSATINLGMKRQLTGTLTPATANSYTATWTSSNTSVATVDSNGLVTGAAGGAATITFRVVNTYENGTTATFTGTCAVTVSSDVPTGDLYRLVSSASDMSAGEYIITYYDGSAYCALSSAVGGVSDSLGYTDVTSQLYTPASGGTYIVAPQAENVFSFTTYSIGYRVSQNGSYVYATSTSNGLSMSTSAAVWVPSDHTEGITLQRANTSGKFIAMFDNGTHKYFQAYDATYIGTSGYCGYLALFKKVEEAVTTYTVTFVDWDGTVLSTQTVDYGGSAASPADPTRTGYTFTGWSGSYVNVVADATITATYSVNTYTVTFVDWDGTVLSTQTVDYGGSATSPADPTRADYEFVGWDSAFDNVTGDLTITAVYSYVGGSATFIGDVNCDGVVTFGDVGTLYSAITSGKVLTAQGLINADCDGDGSITFSDVSALYNMLSGI